MVSVDALKEHEREPEDELDVGGGDDAWNVNLMLKLPNVPPVILLSQALTSTALLPV